MNHRWRWHGRVSIWLLLSISILGGTTAEARADDSPELKANGTCDHPLSFYASSHYKIKTIEVTSPFDYLGSVRQMMQDVLGSTKLHAGDDFSSKPVIEGRRAIRNALILQSETEGLPITVDVVIAEIENCQPNTQPPTLDVVYTTFSTWAPFLFPRTFEAQKDQAADPASATGLRERKTELVPRIGYNATAKLYGGGRTTYTMRTGKFDFEASGSSEVLSLDADYSGKHNWEGTWIQSAEWRTGFTYNDAPTGSERLKRARLTAQFFANSAPIGLSNAVFRFGASIGGGHDQSNQPTQQLPLGSMASSPVGELKTYVGISGAKGRSSFKSSYGFELGTAASTPRIDFAKNITDTTLSTRFLPTAHKPIDFDARLSAGWIENHGAIPAAERFFGGNSEEQFLLGDSWQIRAAPFIRSIAQNRLNHLAPDFPYGGENFISVNATLGVTTWSYPLMPAEIRTNKSFQSILGSELKSAHTILESYWMSRDKEVPDIVALAPQAVAEIRELRKSFDRVQDSVPDALSDRFGNCDFQVTLAEGLADNLEKNKIQSKQFIQIKSLVAENDDGSIDNLVGCLTDLRTVLGADTADAMASKFKGIQEPVRADLAKIDKTVAEAKADRDMAFINQTVNTLVDEMNFVSISPVAIFDVARIGPQASAAGGGARYGVGGGVRFTMLDTIRLDLGYAVNPYPKSWEGRGALFFSLEVIPLFR